jgi:hypothetical protein
MQVPRFVSLPWETISLVTLNIARTELGREKLITTVCVRFYLNIGRDKGCYAEVINNIYLERQESN